MKIRLLVYLSLRSWRRRIFEEMLLGQFLLLPSSREGRPVFHVVKIDLALCFAFSAGDRLSFLSDYQEEDDKDQYEEAKEHQYNQRKYGARDLHHTNDHRYTSLLPLACWQFCTSFVCAITTPSYKAHNCWYCVHF